MMFRKIIGVLCCHDAHDVIDTRSRQTEGIGSGHYHFPIRAGFRFRRSRKECRGATDRRSQCQRGILGVPLRPIFIDEGAGINQLMSEYRRVVLNEKAEVMLASVSSASCLALTPVAEDLEVPNILWDCSSPRILEDNNYKYSVRTQSHSGAEMLAAALYLVKNKADFKTVAGVNQDYAAGRDQWGLFLHRAEGLEARRRGRRRAVPEIWSAGLFNRNFPPSGAAA